MRDLEEEGVYLEHMRLEHLRLNQALRQVQEMLLEVLQKDAVNGRRRLVTERLTDLRGKLAAHFAQEEEGGYLEEAAVRVPRLSGQVQGIEAEHAQLLEGLDAVIAGAAVLPLRDVLARFGDFKRRLQAHERAENRVMAQGFGCNFCDESDELQEP
jgi:hypothetical protein